MRLFNFFALFTALCPQVTAIPLSLNKSNIATNNAITTPGTLHHLATRNTSIKLEYRSEWQPNHKTDTYNSTCKCATWGKWCGGHERDSIRKGLVGNCDSNRLYHCAFMFSDIYKMDYREPDESMSCVGDGYNGCEFRRFVSDQCRK
jgi:hypothetical protein